MNRSDLLVQPVESKIAASRALLPRANLRPNRATGANPNQRTSIHPQVPAELIPFARFFTGRARPVGVWVDIRPWGSGVSSILSQPPT